MMKGEKNIEYKDLVMEILELSDSTNSVELSFGYTDSDKMCRKGIVLRKAAPKILTELVQRGYSADVMLDGVHIYDYRTGGKTNG